MSLPLNRIPIAQSSPQNISLPRHEIIVGSFLYFSAILYHLLLYFTTVSNHQTLSTTVEDMGTKASYTRWREASKSMGFRRDFGLALITVFSISICKTVCVILLYEVVVISLPNRNQTESTPCTCWHMYRQREKDYHICLS